MIDFSGIKTPVYFYDLDILSRTLALAAGEARKYGYRLHYAVKANNNDVIAGKIKDYGFGADCVSGNEIRRVLDWKYHPEGIVFAGVGKTDEEIKLAIENEIFCLNCESLEELEVVAEKAREVNRRVSVALRVNPALEANTHSYITTGKDENKFGVGLPHLKNALDYCKNSPGLDFAGLHFHIGSQIISLEPYRNLCKKVNQIWREFDIPGYGGDMLNLGGGLGIDYCEPENNPIPDFKSFFALFADNLDLPSRTSVHFELGRSLVGQCGRIVTRVLYTKQGVGKKFVIIDAGMTELIRPALYGAMHRIVNVSSSASLERYDVVGPVCESSDVFARDVLLPRTSRGDLVHILSCGAYAESMNMDFNLRTKPGSVFASEGKIVAEEK